MPEKVCTYLWKSDTIFCKAKTIIKMAMLNGELHMLCPASQYFASNPFMKLVKKFIVG